MNSKLKQPLSLLYFATILIFLVGTGIRLYDLTDQPIDFHPTRQLRGAVVARGMYYEMSPYADEATRKLANSFGQSTGEYEPPVLERIVAITYLLIGGEHLWVSRLFTIAFWIIGGIALLYLTRRMAQVKSLRLVSAYASALVSLAYYLVLPFAVQASRSFQPDPGMVMCIILTFYFVYTWSETQRWKWAVLAGVLGGLAILIKGVAIYIVGITTLLLVIFTFSQKETNNTAAGLRRIGKILLSILRSLQVWCMAILMIVPTFLYYMGKEGRASEYFSSWTLALSHLLIEPTFYLQWLNMLQKLMSPVALVLVIAGILLSSGRNRWLILGGWIGYLCYGLFLPYQMYTHTYYHLQVVPLVAISLVPISQWFIEVLLSWNRTIRVAITGIAVGIFVYMSWQALVPLYRENHRNEPVYWQEIASHLPANGKIIALTQDYGYRLMYYGWRKVVLWPNRGERKVMELRGSVKEFKEYFDKRTENVSYFLITSFNQFNDQPDLKQYLYDSYTIIADGQGYIIFDLTHPITSRSP